MQKHFSLNFIRLANLFLFILAIPSLGLSNTEADARTLPNQDSIALDSLGHLMCTIHQTEDCATQTITLEAWLEYTFTGVTQPVTVPWSTGVTAHKITVSPPGVWSWDVSAMGCEVIHQFNTKTINEPFFAGPLAIEGPSIICSSQPEVLTVNAQGYAHFNSFAWSPAYNTLSPYPINAAGIYALSVTDAFGCPFSSQIVVEQGPNVSAGFTYTVNNQTVTFNNTSSNASAYTWDFGNGLTSTLANPVVTFTDPEVYYVCLTASGTCSSTSCQLINLSPDVPWTVEPTGRNHTIILPGNLVTDIQGMSLQTGDYIGVFFDAGGTLKCGGSGLWSGVNTSFAAYGNDATAPGKNGFNTGESFKVKVWKAATNQIFDVTAFYAPVGTGGIVTHTNLFADDGISLISNLTTTVTQECVLTSGWNIISSYIAPAQPDMLTVFAPVAAHVDIIKDGDGISAIPAIAVNGIGNWNVIKGYQVKANQQDTLLCIGQKVVPENTPVPLKPGWQLIGYLRDQPQDAAAVFAGIQAEICLVKDNLGKLYAPEFGINTIGNMKPCQGYKVKALSNTTLLYQANFSGIASELREQGPVLQTVHFVLDSNFNTGNNATLVWTDSIAGIALDSLDEIGVFTPAGVLCGAGIFQNENLAITVWGDDASTSGVVEGLQANDAYTFRVWDSSDQYECSGTAMFLSGTNAYEQDGFEIIQHFSFGSPSHTDLTVSSCAGYVLNNVTYDSSGVYTQLFANAAGCDSTVTLHLTINPVPVVSVTNASICAGEMATLTASGADNYVWSTGETTSQIVVSPGTNTSYTVTGSSAGCPADPSTALVTVTPLPIVNVNSDTICLGAAATLTASGADNYVWSTGETTSQIVVSPDTNTSYTVTGTSSGCTSEQQTTQVVVSLAPSVNLGTDTIIGQGAMLMLNAPTGVGLSYLWSTGATTASITVNSMGTYSVTVSTEAGCSASDEIDVMVISATEQVGGYKISVAPNPTQDVLMITVQGASSNAVQILDKQGKLLLEDNTYVSDGTSRRISLKHLPAGTYFVQIAGDGFSKTVAVLKN